MISEQQLHDLVTELRLVAAEAGHDEDEIVWDSLSLTWFLHVLNERHNVQAEPADVAATASVRQLYRLLDDRSTMAAGVVDEK